MCCNRIVIFGCVSKNHRCKLFVNPKTIDISARFDYNIKALLISRAKIGTVKKGAYRVRRIISVLTAAAIFVFGTALRTEAASVQSSDRSFEAALDAQHFPESYRSSLRELHRLHPNWVFTSVETGLDWNEVLRQESVLGRSLVHSSSLDSWKSVERGAYDLSGGYWYGLDGAWVAASDAVIRHYLDPRNFLDDTSVFMFENLSYHKGIHTKEGVNAILKGTFMSGSYTCPDTGEVKSYADTFMEAAERSGVSPYHLAARCRNEQGVKGAPQSLGTAKGYEGYFNFFDVQAYASKSLTAGQMGARYAKTVNPKYLLPWTNQYLSIIGGSIYLGTGYINKGQDTLYLQKFDVLDGGNGLFRHQYMTCIYGQASEAAGLKRAYSDDVLATAMEFKIPIYKNMPQKPAPKPTSAGSCNDLLRSLNVSGYSLSPDFDTYRTEYSLTVGSEVDSITVNARCLDPKAAADSIGTHRLNEGENTITVTVTSPANTGRSYTLTVTRKSSPVQELHGDVNSDRKIDVVDALMILNASAGKSTLTEAQLKAADVDRNGTADVIDALRLLRFISGDSKEP